MAKKNSVELADVTKSISKLAKEMKLLRGQSDKARDSFSGINQSVSETESGVKNLYSNFRKFDRSLGKDGTFLQKQFDSMNKGFSGLSGQISRGRHLLSGYTVGILGLGLGFRELISDAHGFNQQILGWHNSMANLTDASGNASAAVGSMMNIWSGSLGSLATVQGAMQSLAKTGLTPATEGFRNLGKMAVNLQMAAGLSTDAVGEFAGSLKIKWGISIKGIKGITSNIIAMGDAFQMTGDEMTLVMQSVSKSIDQLAAHMRDASKGIDSLSKGMSGAIGIMKKMGISAQMASDFVGQMLDPERITENIAAYAKMGISYQEINRALQEGDMGGVLDRMTESLPQLSRQIMSIQDVSARINFAKSMAIPLEVASKMARATRGEIEQLKQEYKAKAKGEDALRKKQVKAKADAARFEETLQFIKMKALFPMMQWVRKMYPLFFKMMNTFAKIFSVYVKKLTEFFDGLYKRFKPFIESLLRGDTWNVVLEKFGESFLAALSSGIKKIGPLIGKVLKGIGGMIGKYATPIVEGLTPIIGSAIKEGLKILFIEIPKAFFVLVKELGATSPIVASLIGATGAIWALTKVMAAYSAAKGVAGVAGKVIGGAATFAGAGGGIPKKAAAMGIAQVGATGARSLIGLGAVAGPIGIAVAAIGALTFGIYQLKKAQDQRIEQEFKLAGVEQTRLDVLKKMHAKTGMPKGKLFGESAAQRALQAKLEEISTMDVDGEYKAPDVAGTEVAKIVKGVKPVETLRKQMAMWGKEMKVATDRNEKSQLKQRIAYAKEAFVAITKVQQENMGASFIKLRDTHKETANKLEKATTKIERNTLKNKLGRLKKQSMKIAELEWKSAKTKHSKDLKMMAQMNASMAKGAFVEGERTEKILNAVTGGLLQGMAAEGARVISEAQGMFGAVGEILGTKTGRMAEYLKGAKLKGGKVEIKEFGDVLTLKQFRAKILAEAKTFGDEADRKRWIAAATLTATKLETKSKAIKAMDEYLKEAKKGNKEASKFYGIGLGHLADINKQTKPKDEAKPSIDFFKYYLDNPHLYNFTPGVT